MLLAFKTPRPPVGLHGFEQVCSTRRRLQFHDSSQMGLARRHYIDKGNASAQVAPLALLRVID